MKQLFGEMPSQGGWGAWVASVAASARQHLSDVDSALAGHADDAQALDDQLRGLSLMNALAARTFADSGARSSAYLQRTIEAQANDGRTWSGGDLDALRELRELDGLISAAEVDLMGADASAARAEQAAVSANGLRLVAEARRDDAFRGQATQDSVFTFASARLSRVAADLTAVRSDQAGIEVAITTSLEGSSSVSQLDAMRVPGQDDPVDAGGVVLDRLDRLADSMTKADADVSGTRSERRDGDNPARPEFTPESLRGQVKFYEDIVNLLSGRVDPSLAMPGEQSDGRPVTHGDAVRDAASQMESVRALAHNAARELARQADQARELATSGRDNATRFFGRSLGSYIARAQVAHKDAYLSWEAADAAAKQAKGAADTFGDSHGISEDGLQPVLESELLKDRAVAATQPN
jgi:hypothetical protein